VASVVNKFQSKSKLKKGATRTAYQAAPSGSEHQSEGDLSEL
jgi:hypothetical protein